MDCEIYSPTPGVVVSVKEGGVCPHDKGLYVWAEQGTAVMVIEVCGVKEIVATPVSGLIEYKVDPGETVSRRKLVAVVHPCNDPALWG